MPVAASTAQLDLVERTSYVSSTHKRPDEDGDYDKMKTPNEMDVEGGALREGGAPHLLSKESLGLLSQYAAVGLIYGTLPNLIYPFFTVYLNLEGQTTTAARALFSIPWSLKVFIGIITDCFPIFGYRRRPYMVLGWTVTAVLLFVLTFMEMPKPFYPIPAYRHAKNVTAEMKATFHESSRDEGGKYIILMMLTTLAYLFADVAADGVLVEYAQREPEATRGRTQTAIYTTRTLFSTVANIITGFGLSQPKYGGEFSFGFDVKYAFLIMAIVCLPVIPMTWFFIAEKKVTPPSFKHYIGTLWDLIQTRAVYQVIGFNFLWAVFGGLSYVASDPITSYWVQASAFSQAMAGVLGTLVMTVSLAYTGKYGLHWSWRSMQVITSLAIIAVDVTCTMIVTWDVFRNQWFWLGLPIVEYIPYGMSFIIATYVVVELAGDGNESAMYGLMTTVTNLGAPFALTITKNINASFSVWNADIQLDTHEVRRDVTITIMITYAAKIFSFVFLKLLPRQKAETQELKRNGGKSKAMGIFTICYCTFALVWSIMSNIFSIFPSTKCYKITGGCKK